MNVNEAIKIALNGEAILFLGAGFSIGGTNKMKKSIPTATELSLQMCKELNISESNNLPIVSDRFISDPNIGLGISRMIDFLKSRLICTQVSDEQLTIVKLPWIRIYTTNYDNIVEIASKVSKIYRESITATTEKPKIENLSGAIIHMNGSIQTVTEKNFFNDFKITNESYLRDGFLESPWGDLFVHDINNSKAIIFIGYSMRYDLDLQKVMHNKIRDKSIFIDRANLDENQEYLLNKWGTLEKIETNGFANKIISLQRTHIAKEKKQALQGVEEILITNYRNTSVSANDVLNMLIYGKYDKYSIRANTNFFIKREDYLERVKENIETHQICIIHSNFGNGKTVFLDYLASQLVEENNVYILNDAVHIQDDLRIISQSKSSSNLLLIDDYDMYMTVFKELSYGIPDNVKIIATCRSSISDILLDTLTNKYNISLNSIGIVNIEVLTDKDREYLVKLLNKYNFWGKYATYSHNNKKKLINHQYKNRMNCVLFMLLDSNVINDKIKIIMSDLNDFTAKTYLLAHFICDVCSFKLRGYEVAQLADINFSDVERLPISRETREIFQRSSEDIETRSSVFAQYITYKTLDYNTILYVLKKMFHRALTLNKERYHLLVKKIISRSTLTEIFGGRKYFSEEEEEKNFEEREKIFYTFYDDVQNANPDTKYNPFFWLQFAITALNLNRHSDAKIYFDNAYSYAKQLEDFDCFQLDTHYARYLLYEILNVDSSFNFEKLSHAHNLLMNNSNAEIRLKFVLRQVGVYYEICKKYAEEFSNKQQKHFIKYIKEVIEKFRQYFNSIADGKKHKNQFFFAVEKSVRNSYKEFRKLFEIFQFTICKDIKILDNQYNQLVSRKDNVRSCFHIEKVIK